MGRDYIDDGKQERPAFFYIYTEQYTQLTKVFAHCIYEIYSCCLLYYIFMRTKSRSRSFERPPSKLTFYKQYKEMEFKLTVSPQPFDFSRCCIIELKEGREPQRYVLDYSLLQFLSIRYFGIKKHKQHEGITQVLQLFRQRRFEDHFQYRERYLIVTALHLLLRPQKTIQKNNKIFDKKPKNADKGLQEPAAQDQSQSLAFLAFKVIYFLADYQPNDKKTVNTAEERRTANLSIREEIINLILGTQVQAQISQIAKLKMVGIFSFQLLDTQYAYYLPDYFNQQRFYSGTVVDNKVVYNPTTITVKIFNQLIRTPQRQRLLTGTAGIGKSFSLSLIVTLTNYIYSFKMESQRKYCRFLDKKEEQQFESTQKFFYISVGTYSSQDLFIKAMRCQSSDHFFQDNKVKNIKLTQFISFLNDSYKQQKRKPVIIIDQINLYFSVLRKYELACNTDKMEEWGQKQRKIMFWTNQFHQTLLNSSFSICYSSSANCEIKSNFANVGCQVIKIPQIHSTIVNFEVLHSTDRFIELINTIYFELEKRLAQKNAFQCIELRRKQLDTLLRCDFTKYEANTFPSQLTHYRISLCFCNNLELRELKLFEEGKSEDMHIIKSFESGILNSIRAKCQEIFLRDFNKFLLKGHVDLRHKKLKILADIKQACQGQGTEQNIITYQADPYGVESFQESFNKENATITPGGQLTIYYPPSVYLKVIDKLLKDLNQYSPFFKLFIQQFGTNNGLFGSLLDNSIIKILCSSSVRVKINGTYFNIANLNNKLSFEHFFQPQKTQYIIATKLKDIIAALENEKPGTWVAAEPKIKQQNRPTAKRQEADNSKRIDCILCRKYNNKYEIKSIDFAMSRKIKNIQGKQKKSSNFFTEFAGYVKSQKFQLSSLQHLILCRKENSRKARSEQLQKPGNRVPQIKLTTIPITLFEIQILPSRNDANVIAYGIYQEAINSLRKQE